LLDENETLSNKDVISMNYWLMKSEPEEFSIDDLKRVKREPWSGVRNYQARNFMMKDMKVGDGIFFYHSNTAIPGIAGLAEVACDTYPDPTQFNKKSDYYDAASTLENPRWWLVDVCFKRKLKRIISLDELKLQSEALENFALLNRGNRLSVLPVTAAQWKHILSLE
jgi:predicted RNA-binding protein with PUA-like domain